MHVSSLAFRKGWTAALDAVFAAISQSGSCKPDDIARVLQSLQLTERIKRSTCREIARKYGISRRTVLYWKKEGCPFEKGHSHVLNWMAQRRYLPEGAAKRFSKQIQKRKLQAELIALDDHVMEVHALARLHRRMGLPVEDWMKLPRLTRRRVRPVMERLEKEVLQEKGNARPP